MTPHCNSIQELLAAESSMERPWSAALEDHIQGCEQCAAFAGRLAWTAQSLRNMELVGAPRELEGRVVSACQAGYAEDRAAAEIARMEPLQAPAELDRGMLTLFEELDEEGVLEQGVQAPSALDERVAEDLADLPQAMSRHSLEKLPRLQTPELLTNRLDNELPMASELRQASSGPSIARWTAGAAGLAAAAGLLWMFGGGIGSTPVEPDPGVALQTPNSDASTPERTYSFEVVRPTEISQLSNEALALASQVTGGLDLAASTNRVAVEDDDLSNTAPAGTNATDRTANPRGERGTTEQNTHGGGTGTSNGINPAGNVGPARTTSGGPAYFDAIADAPFTLAYRGVRDVTIQTDLFGMTSQLVYREEVASDGAGSFTIDPLQVITPAMDTYDEERFLLFQDRRASFFFQHRDFRIRNGMLFWENYKVQDLAVSQVVAGRTCDTLLITRKDGLGDNITVVIDPLTSLVMQETRTQNNGTLVSKVVYNSFELAPDLSDLELNSTQSLWIETTLDGLSQVVSGQLLIPVAPPQGFELLTARYRTDAGLGQDETWVQLTYGDGVELAFFLFRQDAQSSGNGGTQTTPGALERDLVRSLPVGPWSILDGRAGGRDVVVVGRVTEADLLLMLQSALD